VDFKDQCGDGRMVGDPVQCIRARQFQGHGKGAETAAALLPSTCQSIIGRSMASGYAKKSVATKPRDLKGRLHLADLYVRMGKHDEARRVLAEALDIKPGSRAVQKRIDCLKGKRSDACPKGYQ